jgi:hypothetical protein
MIGASAKRPTDPMDRLRVKLEQVRHIGRVLKSRTDASAQLSANLHRKAGCLIFQKPNKSHDTLSISTCLNVMRKISMSIKNIFYVYVDFLCVQIDNEASRVIGWENGGGGR